MSNLRCSRELQIDIVHDRQICRILYDHHAWFLILGSFQHCVTFLGFLYASDNYAIQARDFEMDPRRCHLHSIPVHFFLVVWLFSTVFEVLWRTQLFHFLIVLSTGLNKRILTQTRMNDSTRSCELKIRNFCRKLIFQKGHAIGSDLYVS